MRSGFSERLALEGSSLVLEYCKRSRILIRIPKRRVGFHKREDRVSARSIYAAA